MSEAVADLNPIAERIVTVHRMSALLMPRDFCRVRSPVIFFAVKLFQDRRIEFRRDTKIDMRPFDRACAALGDLIDLMKNDQLPGVRHSEGDLFIARNLFILASDRRCRDTRFALLQVCHFHAHVADAAHRHDLALRFVADRIAPHGELQGVAIGIENKKRLFDRRRLGITHRSVKFDLAFFRGASNSL